jgi:hypothetical protein
MGWAGEPWVAIYSATRRDNLVNKSIFRDNNLVNKSTGDDLADVHVKLPGSSYRWMLVANWHWR